MALELGTSDSKTVAVRGSCVWQSPSDRRNAWAGSKGMHTNSSNNLFPTKPFPPYHYQPPRHCIRVKYVDKKRTHTHTHTQQQQQQKQAWAFHLCGMEVWQLKEMYGAPVISSTRHSLLERQAWESDLMQGHHQPPPSEKLITITIMQTGDKLTCTGHKPIFFHFVFLFFLFVVAWVYSLKWTETLLLPSLLVEKAPKNPPPPHAHPFKCNDRFLNHTPLGFFFSLLSLSFPPV